MDIKKEEKEINNMIKSKSGRDGLIDLFAMATAPFSFPLSLAIIVFNTFDSAIEEGKSLDKPMSDEWLEKIANEKAVSDEGLKFLGKKLEKQGYISIRNAKEWVEIEKELLNEKVKCREKRKNLRKDGATALLNRVEQIPSIKDYISFDKAFEKINSVKNTVGVIKDTLDMGSKVVDFFKRK